MAYEPENMPTIEEALELLREALKREAPPHAVVFKCWISAHRMRTNFERMHGTVSDKYIEGSTGNMRTLRNASVYWTD